jgi:hypothetical protein
MPIRDSVVELHETKLYRYLKEVNAEYADRITQFVATLAPILARTIEHFPLYTRHDAHHSFQVAKRIEEVVDPLCFQSGSDKSFNRVELFLLIAAAYAHDLGMTVFPGEEDEIRRTLNLTGVSDWQTSPYLQAHLRRQHSNRGTNYIHQNAEALKIPRHLVTELDAVSRAHNLSIPDLEFALRTPYAADNSVIDVRQLAVILCVADAIEFSDTRVIEQVLAKLEANKRPAEVMSYRENMKHACIGSGVAIDAAGTIVATGTFNEPDVLAVAHHTFDEIEDWLRGYCDVDRHSTKPRLRVRPKRFVRNLNIPGAHFHRLGVRMSKRSVIDLISSNAVWSADGTQAIRELIQNGVEACRYRDFCSPKGEPYKPRVHVNFDRRTNSIVIEDSGCGMTEWVILENFLTVGNSRSRSPEYARDNCSTIAR